MSLNISFGLDFAAFCSFRTYFKDKQSLCYYNSIRDKVVIRDNDPLHFKSNEYYLFCRYNFKFVYLMICMVVVSCVFIFKPMNERGMNTFSFLSSLVSIVFLFLVPKFLYLGHKQRNCFDEFRCTSFTLLSSSYYLCFKNHILPLKNCFLLFYLLLYLEQEHI